MSAFWFQPPSEEQLQAMDEAREHQRAHVIDFQHTVEEAWASLDGEHKFAVAQWLLGVAECSEDSMRSRLAFAAGSLFRMAAIETNKCIVCDKDHDEELHSLLPDAPVERTPENDAADEVYAESQRIIAEHDANMKLYGVEQDFEKGGVRCINCGMASPTLEDRMMKAPGIDGCPGCQYKGGHG